MLLLLAVTAPDILFSQLGGSHLVSFTLQLFFISVPASLSSLCGCTCMCYFVVNLKKGSSYQEVSVYIRTRVCSSRQVNPYPLLLNVCVHK